MGLLDQLSQIGTAARPGLQQLLLMGGGVNQSNLAERLDKVNQLRETQRELDRRDTMRQAIEAAPDRKGRMDIYGKYEPKSEMANLAGLTKLDNNILNQDLIKSKTNYYNRDRTGTSTGNYKPNTFNLGRATAAMGEFLSKAGIPRVNTETGETNPTWTYYTELLGNKLVAHDPNTWSDLGPLYAQSIMAFQKNGDAPSPDKTKNGVLNKAKNAISSTVNIVKGLAGAAQTYQTKVQDLIPQSQAKAQILLKQYKGTPGYSMAIQRLTKALAINGNKPLSELELDTLVKKSINPNYIGSSGKPIIRYEKQGPSLQRQTGY